MQKRVLLKVSGRSLSGNKEKGLDYNVLDLISDQIEKVVKEGIQISIVVGGGNFWHGKEAKNIDPTTSDYMGLLSTSMNALAIQDYLENRNIATRIQSALHIDKVSESYNIKVTRNLLDRDYVPIFSGGTGEPHFTTDMAAILKAVETKSDIVMIVKDCNKLAINNMNDSKEITYDDFIKENPEGLDLSMVTVAKDFNMPIKFFDLNTKDSILRTAKGENLGLFIHK